MSLVSLADNSRTDKNTIHSYLPLYQKLLEDKKETAMNILEIGIERGGSIKLWYDFFINANIYAIDRIPLNQIWEGINNKDRIKLYCNDAYNENLFKENFLNKNIKFDVIIDDGPHTLDTMKKFIKLYSQVMDDDGILIIEDVQSYDWTNTLKEEVPDLLKQYVKVYDLRQNKGRYDDILFTINKTKL